MQGVFELLFLGHLRNFDGGLDVKFGRSFSTEHEVTGCSHLPPCWFAVCLFLKDSC